MVQSTRAKGARSVRHALDYYTSQGWLVDKVEKTGRFIVDKDLYNLFDLVGVKKNHSVFIQVKTNVPPNRAKYLEFASRYAGDRLLVESFTWYDRDGFTILQYLDNGEIVRNNENRKTKNV